MADSFDYSSVHLSSDTEVDPCYEPCCKTGRPIEPVGYCPKCIEFFCQSCLDAHSRLGITARHKIQTGDDMPKSLADKPVKYQICDVHDGEFQDKFCLDHGITVCGMCSVRKHKNCEVKLVTEAHKMVNCSAQKKTLCYDVDLLISYANTVKKSLRDNIDKLEADNKTIRKEAEAHRDKLIEQINKSYQNFIEDVTNKVKDKTELLSASQIALNQSVSDIIPTLQGLQQTKMKKENNLEEFLDLQAHAETVRFGQDKIRSLDMSIVDIEYNLNKAIQPLVDSSNRLGEVSVQSIPFHFETKIPEIQYPYTRSSQERLGSATGRTPLSVNLTSLGKIDVKMKDDTEDCFINGLDVTVDGNILLTDCGNPKIKLYSTAGNLLSYLKLPAYPIDTTVFNGSEAAVSMQRKQIGIINIDGTGSLSMNRIIKCKYYVWGLTAYKNNLIITCDESVDRPRSIQMIDMRGNLIWYVTRDIHSNNLFNCARYLTALSGEDGDTVVVADKRGDTITVLDASSGRVREVCNIKGKEPNGITVDNKGNVFACYKKTGEITVWSGNIKEERYLVSRSKELYYPLAVACDKNRQEICVSNSTIDPKHSRFIHRFKISVA